jgi:uncharacterized membrane protein YhaH (DUF805 family)
MDQSLLKEYLRSCLKEYFWISGRVGRLSYFGRMFLFKSWAVLFLVLGRYNGATTVFIILFLIASWGLLCSITKRLHDLGFPGLWCLILLVPGLNVIGAFYLLLAAGSPDPNIYDFSPKVLKKIDSLNQ